MITHQCEWGGCTAPATTTVHYPAIVPGTGGKERTAHRTRVLRVCDFCCGIARVEAAEQWRDAEAYDARVDAEDRTTVVED